jgi:23S rRNA pseudouridine1911/1915/1917 synthase
LTVEITASGEATVAALVRGALGVPWSRAKALVSSGRVRVDGDVVTQIAARPPAGAVIVVDPEGRRQRVGVLDPARLLHLDRHLAIVDKPAGVLTVPFDASDKDTLVDQLRALLRRRGGRRGDRDPMVGVVQRLDKETSGVLAFARSMKAKRHLQGQLREHSVDRRYLALAHGRVAAATFETLLVQDRGDGLRGSRGTGRRQRGPPPRDAKWSKTHVRPLAPGEGATLVECRLETGRQHQIRIHLAEAGHPLLGERVYVREHPGPRLPAPRVMLHAARLGLVHPATGEALRFDRPPPEDFEAVRRRLGVRPSDAARNPAKKRSS